MGGRSKQEKQAEQQQSQMLDQQNKLEETQQAAQKTQNQELLKRKLALIRSAQGGSGEDIGGKSSGGLTQSIGS